MEINNIDRLSIDNGQSRGVRDTAELPPPPRKDPIREKPELNRQAAPQRPQALMKAVTQSLNQAGLETVVPNAVQGADASQAAQTQVDIETSQNEKAAQALQAFMHSLVQAMNTRKDDAGEKSVSVTSPSRNASHLEGQPLPPNPAESYGGLVSRLEGLARQLDGAPGSTDGGEGLDQLNAAFANLANATAESSTARQGEAPKLQTVLLNMIRNLQSTGDPTLASTGNIINTAA